MLYLSRAQLAAVDDCARRKLGISDAVLMENAGRSAAIALAALHPRGRTLLICGKGKNGGDGLVMARHLAIAGVECEALLTSPTDSLAPECRATLQALSAAASTKVCEQLDPGSILADLTADDWIVDALLGTGFRGPLRGGAAAWVQAMNASRATRVALDIPSGLECDTGLPSPYAVRAAHTLTFGAFKLGFGRPHAAEYTGAVQVLSIGVSAQFIAAAAHSLP